VNVTYSTRVLNAQVDSGFVVGAETQTIVDDDAQWLGLLWHSEKTSSDVHGGWCSTRLQLRLT